MLKKNKIIAVLTIEDSKKSLDLAKCLYDSGIINLDIRLRTSDSKKAIESILKSNLNFNIGVGTVLNENDLIFLKSMNIKYAFSPHTDRNILRQSKKYNIDFIPGVSTSIDIEIALNNGCKYLKYFHAEKLGGVTHLDSISNKIKDLKIIAMGGINNLNISPYLNHKNIIGIGASWIATEDLIRDSNWNEISKRARLLLNL